MSVFDRGDGSVLVEEYNLNDFLNTVVGLAQDGYVLGVSNKDYPQAYVGNFTVGMVKSKDVPSVSETTTTKRTPKASASKGA